jgi:hypothetical protein
MTEDETAPAKNRRGRESFLAPSGVGAPADREGEGGMRRRSAGVLTLTTDPVVDIAVGNTASDE